MSTSPVVVARPARLLATLRAVLHLTWEASPSLVLTTVALSACGAVIPPIVIWPGKHLVDLVVGGADSGTSFGDVLPTVVALGTATAALRALAPIQAHRQTRFATVVELHAERCLLERLAE